MSKPDSFRGKVAQFIDEYEMGVKTWEQTLDAICELHEREITEMCKAMIIEVAKHENSSVKDLEIALEIFNETTNRKE